ncbi:TMEM165/GDT1 family protein [bacterium]|nr:TMEM165/GDT1 family protein [bacterium]
MFWKTLITTFGVIFIAELGDKTQLAVLSLAAGKHTSHWAIFFGAVLALALVTLLAFVLGHIIGTNFPRQYVRKVAGVVFVVIGLLMFIGKF